MNCAINIFNAKNYANFFVVLFYLIFTNFYQFNFFFLRLSAERDTFKDDIKRMFQITKHEIPSSQELTSGTDKICLLKNEIFKEVTPNVTTQEKLKNNSQQKESNSIATIASTKSAKSTISSVKTPRKVFDKLPSRQVRVSHVESAELFYVQTQSFLSISQEFHNLCNDEAKLASHPDEIVINSLYLASHPSDSKFYRVKAISKGETSYQVFFIDYGRTTNIGKGRYVLLHKYFI